MKTGVSTSLDLGQTLNADWMNSLQALQAFSQPIGIAITVFTVAYIGHKLMSPHRSINWVSILLQLMAAAVLINPVAIIGTSTRIVLNVAQWALGGSPDKNASQPVENPPPAEAAPQSSGDHPTDWSWVPGLAVGLGIAALLAASIAGGVVLYHWITPRRNKRRAEAAHQSSMLDEAKNKLQKVILESARYETDLGLQIEYPMMTDLSESTVSRYVKDMRRAQELERSLPAKPTLDQVRIFSDAVTDLEVNFEAAVARAEKVRWSGFSVAEKKRLKDAQTALSVIEDSSTTEEQRNAQYKRIVKLLEGLINLTEPVKLALSARVPMLAIEGGTSNQNNLSVPMVAVLS